jgi:adenylate cyclase
MEAPPLERKLVAILAADVVGYSRMMGVDEEGTLATLSSFRTVIDALITRYGGRICGTAGDSVLAAFDSALAAVQCAVDIQNSLAASNEGLEARRMRFRVGVNVGDVMLKEGDIFGDGVNIATRLEGLAEPGGICISRGVHDHVMRKLPYRFEDLGEKNVKNIAQPIRVFRILLDAKQPTPLPETSSADGLDDLPTHPEGEPHSVAGEDRSVEIVFWESINESVRAADYEAYLAQYPEGNFVALARGRLEAIGSATDAIRDPQDRKVELSYWETVRAAETPATLQAYLEKYPAGEFKALAEIRLAVLTAESPEAIRQSSL